MIGESLRSQPGEPVQSSALPLASYIFRTDRFTKLVSSCELEVAILHNTKMASKANDYENKHKHTCNAEIINVPTRE